MGTNNTLRKVVLTSQIHFLVFYFSLQIIPDKKKKTSTKMMCKCQPQNTNLGGESASNEGSQYAKQMELADQIVDVKLEAYD